MNESVELSYGQVRGFARRGLPLALALGVLLGAVLYLYAQRRDPSFSAQTVLVATTPTIDFRSLGLPDVSTASLHVEAYGVAATSEDVLTRALASLGRPTGGAALQELQHNLEVRTDPVPELIFVTASATSPTVAADEANALAGALLAWDKDRATHELDRVASLLQQRITSQRDTIQALQASGGSTNAAAVATEAAVLSQEQGQLDSLNALRASIGGALTVLQPAAPPAKGIGFPTSVFAILGVVLGLLLGYGLTFLAELFDASVYTVEGMERATSLPTLISVPRGRGRGRIPAGLAGVLRANLATAAGDGELCAVQVTSSRYGHGSARAAIVLAESFARRGLRTLLIDADMNRPSIARHYKLERHDDISLLATLRAEKDQRLAMTTLDDSRTRLSLLYEVHRVGDGAAMLKRSFAERLAVWRAEYQRVVVNTAPVALSNDSALVARACDATILAFDPRRTRLRATVRSLVELRRAGAHLVGCIATGVTRRQARTSTVHSPSIEAGPSVPERVLTAEPTSTSF